MAEAPTMMVNIDTNHRLVHVYASEGSMGLSYLEVKMLHEILRQVLEELKDIDAI